MPSIHLSLRMPLFAVVSYVITVYHLCLYIALKWDPALSILTGYFSVQLPGYYASRLL